MPLTTDRSTPARDGMVVAYPVAASTKIFAGSLVALSATGYAVPGSTAVGLKAAGRAEEAVDNSDGADGDVMVRVMRNAAFLYKNAAVDPIDQADVLNDCYIVDDESVAATDGTGTRSKAGKILIVESGGVWVEIL